MSEKGKCHATAEVEVMRIFGGWRQFQRSIQKINLALEFFCVFREKFEKR